MTSPRILLVGHGMVGQRFLEELATHADGAACQVDVLCAEPRAAYDRVRLTSYLGGETAEALALWTPGFAARTGYRLHLDTVATHIDRDARRVRTGDGRQFDYDVLVLATGSYPFRPPVPGNELPGCHVYRTLEDLDGIARDARWARIGTVIGGGLLGLEAAKALHDLGLETHVVEFAPRLMAVQLDTLGARLLRRKIEALGVRVHVDCATARIAPGTACRLRLDFAGPGAAAGGGLDSDLVVFSAGIRPQDALARGCGLAVGERGGIVIDDACRTSDPAVFAIGECALWGGRTFGLVAPGYRMAEVAARVVLGGAARFTGADMSTQLKLLGVDVASIGDAQGSTPGALETFLHDDVAGVYRKLVIDGDRSRLLGAVLVGASADYATLLSMVRDGTPLPPEPAALLGAAPAGMPRGAGVGALPLAATICTCNNVDRGAIHAAIDAGHTTVGALKKCTRAGTSCGGCTPLLKQLLEHELKARGVGIDHRLCEHFAHSRQALFHLVRSGGLRTFDEVLRRHGQGLGCEVCKPTVASILASCWNEHVLVPSHAATQDSNDYFLANIQRNGTYSVVPRIPGGEITPARLVALGEIAQRFGLYTKITGGQRIDLLGARVEQLPAIWSQLIAAGFESGHAYGKAVRTVKSCVGSTWCRFGVQDSVSMAIALEQRYRGVRSPHKLKLAVSGCTRECAEAQGKDVGVIASEKGWNLYVGGNGGSRPRHAELLASDLDDAMLVRCIDRFLMFYIRTADRLQRTSTWMENVEGGIDYVRRVVCDDALGICDELEAAMQSLVDSYVCEWKVAVETPSVRARFRQFVNSGAGDDRVRFVDERGQIRPATPRDPTGVPA
jgi:nitrite reductase (NADH) large subunit